MNMIHWHTLQVSYEDFLLRSSFYLTKLTVDSLPLVRLSMNAIIVLKLKMLILTQGYDTFRIRDHYRAIYTSNRYIYRHGQPHTGLMFVYNIVH